MSEYRTPREQAETEKQDALIREVLEEATVNCAILIGAIDAQEPAELVELWVDTLYDKLRAALDEEHRLRAIVLLLEEAAMAKAAELRRPLPDACSPLWRTLTDDPEAGGGPVSDYSYGPLHTYEITWRTGHVETVEAHQVTWPQAGLVLEYGGRVMTSTEASGRRRVLFHGEIDGRWRLVLAADEDDIRTVRDVTADEPIPGGAR